jgi:hypothetical protein
MVRMHCKQFSINVFPKRFSQASRVISTKSTELQYDVLSGIMIFCREVHAAIHLSAQVTTYCISKRIPEISEVQEIHISRLELQRWYLEFFISFSKVYI